MCFPLVDRNALVAGVFLPQSELHSRTAVSHSDGLIPRRSVARLRIAPSIGLSRRSFRFPQCVAQARIAVHHCHTRRCRWCGSRTPGSHLTIRRSDTAHLPVYRSYPYCRGDCARTGPHRRSADRAERSSILCGRCPAFRGRLASIWIARSVLSRVHVRTTARANGATGARRKFRHRIRLDRVDRRSRARLNYCWQPVAGPLAVAGPPRRVDPSRRRGNRNTRRLSVMVERLASIQWVCSPDWYY